jgi:hypothetical protein
VDDDGNPHTDGNELSLPRRAEAPIALQAQRFYQFAGYHRNSWVFM